MTPDDGLLDSIIQGTAEQGENWHAPHAGYSGPSAFAFVGDTRPNSHENPGPGGNIREDLRELGGKSQQILGESTVPGDAGH